MGNVIKNLMVSENIAISGKTRVNARIPISLVTKGILRVASSLDCGFLNHSGLRNLKCLSSNISRL